MNSPPPREAWGLRCCWFAGPLVVAALLFRFFIFFVFFSYFFFIVWRTYAGWEVRSASTWILKTTRHHKSRLSHAFKSHKNRIWRWPKTTTTTTRNNNNYQKCNRPSRKWPIWLARFFFFFAISVAHAIYEVTIMEEYLYFSNGVRYFFISVSVY